MPVALNLQYGGYGGAVTIILVWIIGLAGIDVPPTVSGALTLLISWGLSQWHDVKSGENKTDD